MIKTMIEKIKMINFEINFHDADNSDLYNIHQVWAYKTSLTLPLFIEVPVLIEESERHVYVPWVFRFFLFLRFFYSIYEVFWV